MEDMIETVRLFRKKEEDIWAIFILEFFKMIGCITADYILPVQDDNVYDMIASELRTSCDVTILWNLPPQKIEGIDEGGDAEKSTRVIVVEEEKKDETFQYSFEYFQSTGRQIVKEQILDKIWGNDSESKNEILFLWNKYAESDLFFYWYNKGNLKFVQEYYPLKGTEGRNTDKRKRAYQTTFEKGSQCYNELIAKENEYGSYYYRFALIHLQNELNCINGLMSGFVFYAENLLEQAKQLKSDYPDQIRINYLQATICETDSYLLWDAEVYYLNAILKFKKKYDEERIGYFLYYKLGKYYEKKRKNIGKAEIYYRKAVQHHPTEFRSLYKIGKIEEQKRHYNGAAKAANDIIKNVLNGYELSQLMPKEQIYIYKSYVLLGDIFSSRGFYTHAIVGYRRALKVSDIISLLFLVCEKTQEEPNSDKFADVIKSCMPKQAVYRKMINVATKTSNEELVEECFAGMNRGE